MAEMSVDELSEVRRYGVEGGLVEPVCSKDRSTGISEDRRADVYEAV
jgi:hypothetical protein